MMLHLLFWNLIAAVWFGRGSSAHDFINDPGFGSTSRSFSFLFSAVCDFERVSEGFQSLNVSYFLLYYIFEVRIIFLGFDAYNWSDATSLIAKFTAMICDAMIGTYIKFNYVSQLIGTR